MKDKRSKAKVPFWKFFLPNYKNPCMECLFWVSENNTCQSKKVCTGGPGYVTMWDRLFCKPFIDPFEGEDEEDG